ncbi:hypothetical protein PhCBS80983_g02992 [Powellomyces hirtus]|uniref:Uncharacterized protein n=1 Tax=Powellomyces hirtus TaxID=109895 RepID=A0A507E668_9FUNG|nr:hypothetical protein PhCBS80983_g02992 [Powellomyces hirtus]
MVRVNGLDFYTGEMAMTSDGTLIRIMNFFKVKGKLSFSGTILTELPALPETPVGQLFTLARHPLSSVTRPVEDLLPSASITMVVKQEADGAILNIQAPVNHWRQTANGRWILVVPLVMFCDGSSGNISKQWNNHDTWIFTLAGLPFDQQSSDYHQHFVCTSNGLDGMEMTSAIVAQLKQLTEGISCVHGVSHEPLLVIGGLLCLLGNNPQSSKFCCHNATGLIELVSTPTTQRNWQTTAAIIAQQLQLLFEKHTKTKLQELQTATGVKCVLAQKVIDKRRNPLLQLPGFDGHLDTPVEVLHTVLLGFVKYVGNQTIKYGLVTGANRATNKAAVIARIDSFDANGTDRGPMRGSTFVTYVGSLIGRDFKAFIQAGVFIFHGLIADDVMAMWEKLAVLSALVHENRISNLDAYCDQLEAATDAFFAAVASFSIRLFKKTKYHIFHHLVQDVCCFGLPRHYHTETSERFNHAIRSQSVHSNRQAPSLDIASGFSLLATMSHVVSGGILLAPVEPEAPLELIHASEAITCLAGDPTVRALFGIQPKASAFVLHKGMFVLLQDRRLARIAVQTKAELEVDLLRLVPDVFVVNLHCIETAQALRTMVPQLDREENAARLKETLSQTWSSAKWTQAPTLPHQPHALADGASSANEEDEGAESSTLVP